MTVKMSMDDALLVFITSGHYQIGGRISNYFDWCPIRADGTLGRKSKGYWDRKWSSPEYPPQL